MKRRPLLVGIGLIATFATTVSWLQSSEPSAAKPSLAESVEQLTERVLKLESQIDELKRQPAIGNSYTPGNSYAPGSRYTPRSNDPVPPTPPQSAPYYGPDRTAPPAIQTPPPAVPETWQRFEFNGQTFYIVPVDQLPGPRSPSNSTDPITGR
jgi:hypothetical protein